MMSSRTFAKIGENSKRKNMVGMIRMGIMMQNFPVRDKRNFSIDNGFRIEKDGSYLKVKLPVNKLRSLQFQRDKHRIGKIINRDNGSLDFLFLSEAAKLEIIKSLNNQSTAISKESQQKPQKDLEDFLSATKYIPSSKLVIDEKDTPIVQKENYDEYGSITHTLGTEKSKNQVQLDEQVKTLLSTIGLPTLNSASNNSSPTLESNNQTHSYENTDVRVPWMETVGNLIDRGILTWDHTGNILSCPEDEEFFKDQLLAISAKHLKYPILSFKKNMANHLFRKLPSDTKRIRYTNELYNRTSRFDEAKQSKLMTIVQQRFKAQNEAKKQRKKEGRERGPVMTQNAKRATTEQPTNNGQLTHNPEFINLFQNMQNNSNRYNL